MRVRCYSSTLLSLAFEARPARPRPRAEEGLLHRILRQCVVAKNPECEPIGKPAEATVELGQRLLVGASDQGDHRLVREMSKLAWRRSQLLASPPAQRDHSSLSPVARGH